MSFMVLTEFLLGIHSTVQYMPIIAQVNLRNMTIFSNLKVLIFKYKNRERLFEGKDERRLPLICKHSILPYTLQCHIVTAWLG